VPVIILTTTESEEQIISGVPEFVEFSTNVPATIFYTLDGTTPDSESEMYVERLYLPTNINSLTLKAVAVSGSMSSDVFEADYAPDATDLNRTRNIGPEGINTLPAGDDPVDSLGFDQDGQPAGETAIPFVDLELKTSRRDKKGIKLPKESAIDFINFLPREVVTPKSAITRITTPNNNNPNFDPAAGTIVVDGTTEEKLRSQVVQVVNRPHGSMDSVGDYDKHQPGRDLATANLVRAQYNGKTGKMIFYYRDSRDNRWIKSIQKTTPTSLNLTPTYGGNRYVFQWVEDRYFSGIY
jgi:hypothetical protein